MLRFDRPLERGTGCVSDRREDVMRRDASEREIDSLKRVLAKIGSVSAADTGGQHAATSSRPGHEPRHQERGSACVPQTPAEEAGHSITGKCNAFGATDGLECRGVAGASSPQLRRNTDRNRRCNQRVWAAWSTGELLIGDLSRLACRRDTSRRWCGATRELNYPAAQRRCSVTRLRAAWASRGAGPRI
jgi:hypothetical protein